MNVQKISISIKVIFFLILSACSYSSFANDIDTLKSRIAKEYADQEAYSALGTAGLSLNAQKQINNQQADGSWADIKYSDIPTDGNQIRTHLSRLRILAAADYLHLQSGASQALIKGLDYWYSLADRHNSNWWWNEIGKQLYLGPIAVMAESQLSSAMLAQITAVMPAAPYKTGANRTDLSKGVIWGGLLLKDDKRVALGLEAIEETLTVTTQEGIQSDFSFQQHGAQLYTAGYGEVFFETASFWAYQVRDLTWKFEQDKIDVLTSYFLEGARWMNYSGRFDYNVRGRSISRKDNSIPSRSILLTQADYIKALSPLSSSQTDAFKSHIKNGTSTGLSGFKSFWRSDYVSKMGPEHFIGIKMNSVRTEPTESGNGENLLGYWLGFGSTFIMHSGNEYNNIFPVWNWKLVPGVTAPEYEAIPANWGKVEQQVSFVGGVSDGTYGAAVMEMDFLDTQAKKSWFSFDNELVALGSAITSTRSENVNTTINQAVVNGPVTVDGVVYPEGAGSLANANWVHHDNVGYVFPGGWSGKISNQSQTGSWQRINSDQSADPLTKDVFTLSIDHGLQPSDGTYEYIIVPDKTALQLADYAAKLPVEVLSNSKHLQAVRHAGLSLSGAVFYQAGTLQITADTKLTVNKPSVVLVDQSGAQAKITIATPGVGMPVTVTFSSPSENKSTTIYTSSAKSDLGKSMLVNFDAPVVPQQIVLNTNADTYVRDGASQDNNYGSKGYLTIKSDGSGYSRKAIVKFDLFPAEPILASNAKLRLYIRTVNSGPARTVTISRLADSSWDENKVAWSSMPAVEKQGPQLQITAAQEGSWVEIDVSSLVLDQSGKVTLLIENRGPAESTSDFTIMSREGGKGPELVINP
ncbi:polysaccharide lyase family 8 super-sandwich domain-containing protein [Psychromonas aquimarina]|uniref:polysaccharide lyase family 8 super-sandwich domain-containing protein n=1 Tax=Psychromonas aquimarina TaxID=444919 RepID=UPI000429FDFB|nr:polysaccharide lyase family 8 super-sandwich domain-containing protein [Psychromonas aquimarina]